MVIAGTTEDTKRGNVSPIPSQEEINAALIERHSEEIHSKLQQASVAVMGLGGLGSSVAVALARIGVGKLVLADYDVVDLSNLNRQYYFFDQVGMLKTEALKQNLVRINPYISIDLVVHRLSEEMIPELFGQVDVLMECFDDPVMKAAGLRAALTALPGVGYVGASGMAGYGDNNTIHTRKMKDHVFLVGDFESAAEDGISLMAPRVGIAAHQQANQAVRILLGVDE
ncbi:MAG: sulfur carrier protein ThiS adenylyltransferase ThiF [Desulfobulbaceae bacterium]|uniref:Sulfur carrier protein ThiS adenylyltransferase ThiF n=1 Tax=Candidatus Desulfobia pelagia TaxID=2841692 RepID=A0A8J6TG92_9BACT|nr:sulfur carrier protein ThiS adenylyltransferase ThiF [Candidatus Desulfobia pelagia]